MINKHHILAFMISASMGISMLISPATVLAGEEAPAAEEVQEAATEEAPSEEEPASEEHKETIPAQDAVETPVETPAATEEDEPVEEKTEAAKNITEETDESIPAGIVEETPELKADETEPAVKAPEEEIKETSVDGLLGGWEGEGFYTLTNTKTGKVEGIKPE